MKKILIGLTTLAAICLLAQTAPKTVKLAWNANTETDLAGYCVYWGIVASGITNGLTVTTNAATLNNLAVGNYWFAVTARSTNAIESDFSNIVLASIPQKPGNLRIVP